MDKVTATIYIDLDTFRVADLKADGYTDDQIIETVKRHVEKAIGNSRLGDNAPVIECQVEHISEVA